MSDIGDVRQRPAEPGELCSCGNPAVVVYVVDSDQGRREVPHCGVNR